jgi:hypothetical protein
VASVRDIFIRLGVKTDPRGFQRVTQGINNMRASAITLGRVLLTGVVALGFKKMIDVASDIQETANKFGAVFGEAGGTVQKQLDEIRKQTGATNLELQSMASNIGALIKPALGSAEAAGFMAAEVSGLALDIASFNNVAASDAIIALRSGLIGSAEPLQRFGVDTRVAALELEAMRQGISGSIQAMTEGQRIQLRFAAIQRQLGAQGATGDATRTAKDFANASRNLGQAIKETAGIIGTFFLNSVGGLVNKTRELIDSFQQWLGANRKLIQQKIDTFLNRVGRVISAVSDFIGRIVTAIKEWSEGLGPLGQRLLRIATVVGIIAAILLLPGGSILILLALIGLLIEDFETWRKGGESVIGDIIEWFGNLNVIVKILVGTFGLLALALGVKLVAAFIAAKIAAIASAIAAAAAWIAATWPILLMIVLVGALIGVLIWMIANWDNLGEAIKEALLTALQHWLEFFGLTKQSTEDFRENLSKTFNEFWTNVIEFWKAQFMDFFKWVDEKVGDFVPDVSGLFFDDEEEVEKKADRQAKKAIARMRKQIAEEEARAGKTVTGPQAVSASPTGGGSVVNAPTTNVNVEVKAAPGMNVQQLSEETAVKTAKKVAEVERRQAAKNFSIAVE